jgi:PHD/YefM family antitoxin component YafN of YafNO toxin-antitoxin module
MQTYTTREFRAKLKLAMDKTLEGEEVIIIRKGQLFVLQVFRGSKGESNTTV